MSYINNVGSLNSSKLWLLKTEKNAGDPPPLLQTYLINDMVKGSVRCGYTRVKNLKNDFAQVATSGTIDRIRPLKYMYFKPHPAIRHTNIFDHNQNTSVYRWVVCLGRLSFELSRDKALTNICDNHIHAISNIQRPLHFQGHEVILTWWLSSCLQPWKNSINERHLRSQFKK